MATDQLKALWEAVGTDVSLREKIAAAYKQNENNLDAAAASVSKIAENAGFTVSATDLLSFATSKPDWLDDDEDNDKVLSETELAAVAGGAFYQGSPRGNTGKRSPLWY